MHDNSQVIALSPGNSNRFSQNLICDFQFSQICEFAIRATDYYHKIVKNSLLVVCGCMFLVKTINSLVREFKSCRIFTFTSEHACFNIVYLGCCS